MSDTENSLNSELTNDVLSGFLGCEDADNRRTSIAFNGKDHLDKTSPPSEPPVLDDPAGLLNFVGLKAMETHINSENEWVGNEAFKETKEAKP